MPLALRLALALVLALVGGCSRAGGKPSGGAAARVVSLSPSTTETMFVLGVGDKVVGRSRYCNWPPEVLSRPQVGGYVDPSFEAILALRPDLVIGARGPAGTVVTDRLAARDVATYFPETESLAAIDAMILGVGERTGAREAAVAYVAEQSARIARIEAAARSAPRVRVLLVFGLEPLVVAGPGSFPDEMLRKVGATNAVEAGGAYPALGIERVLALDPDVVIDAAMGEARSAERMGKDAPGWGRVRAIREGRLVAVSDESVLRPGPRIADGLERLARAVHPGLEVAAP